MFEYSTLFLSLLKSNASYQENPDPAKKNKKIYIALSFSPIKNSGEVKTCLYFTGAYRWNESIYPFGIHLPITDHLTGSRMQIPIFILGTITFHPFFKFRVCCRK